jgi:hypothetical protein
LFIFPKKLVRYQGAELINNMREIIENAIEEYHKYRSDVVIRLVTLEAKGFTLEFDGDFCHTCGLADEYQLVKFFLEDKGLIVDVAEITEFEEGFIAKFKIIELDL